MKNLRMALERSRFGFALSLAVVAGVVLAAQRIKRTSAFRPSTRDSAPNEVMMRLPDGRRVAVASHGDPQGKPLLLFHGIPGSRLGHEFTDTLAKERGVRVLCPDRPGIDLSDPKSERALSGYPDDVAALANALGLERFAVVGVSGGGPYALQRVACGLSQCEAALMKAYSKDLRLKVLAAVDRGMPRAALVGAFSVSPATIKRWLKKRRETGGVDPEPILGPPAPKREALEERLPAQARANPDLTLAEHCELFEETRGMRVSTATMSRAFGRLGLSLKKSPSPPPSATRKRGRAGRGGHAG